MLKSLFTSEIGIDINSQSEAELFYENNQNKNHLHIAPPIST